MTPPNIPLVIERHLRAAEAKSGWRRDRLHASDLGAMIEGEGCPRQIWMRLRGSKGRASTPGELLLFRRANAIHEELAETLKAHLPVEYPGWSVVAVEEADLTAYGEARLDILIEGPGGERWVIDIKSKRGRAFLLGKIFTLRAAWQVRDYAKRWDTKGAIIVATDREGSNFCQQQIVERDDDGVASLWAALRAMAASPKAPPMLPPKVTLAPRKKLGDAVSTSLEWPCKYCAFADVSCPTTVPMEWRDRVAGHVVRLDVTALAIAGQPIVEMKSGAEALRPAVEAALARLAAAERLEGGTGVGQSSDGGENED